MPGVVLDPKVKAVVDVMADMAGIDLDRMPVDQAMAIARPRFPVSTPPEGSEDHIISGHGGSGIRIRFYHPRTRTRNCPIVLYLHGGGFVAGSIEMDDIRCSRFANAAGCIVASLDYRLAPENPFPIAIRDAFEAWNWLNDNASRIGGAGSRLAVYGSSAGGHIAAGVALLCRREKQRIPDFQLLVNPALDPLMGSQSYRDFSDGPFMTRNRMAWYWKQYAGTEADKEPWLWAPLTAEAKGMPPTFVITAEYDVLRDEGEAYARHLCAAGVEASVERYAGMIHGFMTILPDHEASLKAMTSSATALRSALLLTRQ